jgi:hypothetical protein
MIVILGGTLSGIVSFAIVNLTYDAFSAALITILVIMPIIAVLTLVPLIGLEKIRVQLLKDYFLSLNQTL